MLEYRTKPLLSSILLIIIIIFFHKLPLHFFFTYGGFDEYHSESYDTIITNFISIILIFFLTKNTKVPFKLFSFEFNNLKYYLPLILFIIVFSGGFKDFLNFNFSSISFNLLFTYILKYFSSSFLEEFVFRGFILGIFILNFPKTRIGVFKSVALSGLIFGLMHIINLWTFEGQTIKGILNQVYATTCFGIMYGATYLKTRSILTLGILHFISNFFSMINELEFIALINNSVNITDKSLVNIIITEIFRIIIFGIPLVIGLFLIYNTDRDDLNKLIYEKQNVP
ncbi:CPBP family intramembrane glutamic endopeptidase [Psychroserpens sp. NJDZ02]|uniref:CPBP family intramembrane glutamic endopeptidase n=1 Tax=Psychroserpens sp. NJDZ02 TaxID=2570561 RepID=UPI0010A78B72|nr:CPBP family intramembrane glutamic endopeptidase [Psychroserpens sp. NJDZ02]QCE43055.1 CPBP family intramembrane metalloprotease [Psychroserpens sp. NJDZ02]